MKLRYYELMIKLALQEDNYLDACKAWQEVWDTEDVKNNEQQNLQVSHTLASARGSHEYLMVCFRRLWSISSCSSFWHLMTTSNPT
jgi:26S proteasome regulatory subunit N5